MQLSLLSCASYGGKHGTKCAAFLHLQPSHLDTQTTVFIHLLPAESLWRDKTCPART